MTGDRDKDMGRLEATQEHHHDRLNALEAKFEKLIYGFIGMVFAFAVTNFKAIVKALS